jgi:hypothetical protein
MIVMKLESRDKGHVFCQDQPTKVICFCQDQIPFYWLITMRASIACLVALCLAQSAMAAKQQQITLSPPPPPATETFVVPGVSA